MWLLMFILRVKGSFSSMLSGNFERKEWDGNAITNLKDYHGLRPPFLMHEVFSSKYLQTLLQLALRPSEDVDIEYYSPSYDFLTIHSLIQAMMFLPHVQGRLKSKSMTLAFWAGGWPLAPV